MVTDHSDSLTAYYEVTKDFMPPYDTLRLIEKPYGPIKTFQSAAVNHGHRPISTEIPFDPIKKRTR